ncbi:MAG TPA: hypothetical protein VHC46_09650 [Thermodesulfobacteriota bacterium]|nr:hypothetical protein [Thermodesulfobacteriota bacterium]
MQELEIEGKTYISSRRAAEITGYAKDYVGQLCREGRVEARLVGRNWYILESSIREHRFGEEEKTQEMADAAPQRAWESPVYVPERPQPVPMLTPREASEARESYQGAEKPDHGALLTDMQSAWQEWFTRKKEHAEPLEEATEQPVSIVRSPDEEELPEEAEAIMASEPQNTLDLTHIDELRGEVEEEDEAAEEEPEEEYEEIVEERVRRYPGTAPIRAAFIAITLIAIVVTLIGTGFAGKYGGSIVSRIPEVHLISGVYEVEK